MNHRLDAWEMGAAIVTLTLVVAAVWLPAVAVGAGIIGVFVGLGVGLIICGYTGLNWNRSQEAGERRSQ